MKKTKVSSFSLVVLLAALVCGSAASVDTVSSASSELTIDRYAPPELIETLPITGVHSMALNRRARQIVVAQEGQFSLVDTRSLDHKDVEVSPFGGRIVVDHRTGLIFAARNSALSVYDQSGTLVAAHSARPGYRYERISYSAKNRTVYAVQLRSHYDSRQSFIEAFSAGTGDMIASVQRSHYWQAPVVDPTNGNVWTYNEDLGKVEVFNSDLSSSLATMDSGISLTNGGLDQQNALVIVPKIGRAFMVGSAENWLGAPYYYEYISVVRVFDSKALQEFDPIPLAVNGSAGHNPSELAFNYRTRELLVRQWDRLTVINTTTNEIKTETEYPAGHRREADFALDARRGFVYLPSKNLGSDGAYTIRMVVMSSHDYSLVADIEVPLQGQLLSTQFDGATGRFFIGGYGGIGMSVFGPTTRSSLVAVE